MILTFEAPAREKSSAAACSLTRTVDEPSAVMDPERFFRLKVGFTHRRCPDGDRVQHEAGGDPAGDRDAASP